MELWMLRCSLLALSLLYSNTAAQPGSDLRCTNDYVRHMFCGFGRGSERLDPSDCHEYKLHTEVKGFYKSTERNCSFSTDPRDRSGTCGCSMDVGKIVPGEEHTTTLWRAGHEVITKIIPVRENILPRTPIGISVERMSENGSYIVKWNKNYSESDAHFDLMHTVSYRRGEKGTPQEFNTSYTSYEILAKSLESRTEYVVNVKSYCSYYSESTEKLRFTTPVSSSTMLAVVVLSLCVAAVFITSSLYLLCTRYKEKWWDNVGKYKNSTLLVMVPVEHKMLIPQKTALCSVLVDARPKDKDHEKPGDGSGSSSSSSSSSSGGSYPNAGGDSVSSSLGYSQKVSMDIISNMEAAMRQAFPQICPPPPTTATPWLSRRALINIGYNPVPGPGASTLCLLENRTYFMAPPCGVPWLRAEAPLSAVLSEALYRSCTPLSGVSETLYHPCTLLRGELHDPSVPSQLPIFQLTGQPLLSRLDSSNVNTDFSLWNSDLGSVSRTCALQTDLSYGSFPWDTTSSCEEELSVNVCDSSLCEALCPTPACSLLPVDDDYQGFQSVVRRPGLLSPEGLQSTGTPQGAIARPSVVVEPLPTATQGALQDQVETPANKVSVPPADLRRLIVISDYHSV